MNTKDCPVCGAKNGLIKTKQTFVAKYGQEKVPTEIEYYRCRYCNEELFLDLEEQSQKAMSEALEKAKKNNVSKILSNLDDTSSFATIERSFGLPPRTLSKWKTQAKTPSATAAAFINLLGVFPWLTKVAFCNYDSKKANTIAAYELLSKALENPFVTANFEINDLFNSITIKDSSKTSTNKRNVNINNLAIQGGSYDNKQSCF